MCPIEDTGDLIRRSERKRKPVDYKIDFDNSAFELGDQSQRIDKGKGRMPPADNNSFKKDDSDQLSTHNETKKRKNLSLSKSKRSYTHTYTPTLERRDQEAIRLAIERSILDVDGPHISESAQKCMTQEPSLAGIVPSNSNRLSLGGSLSLDENNMAVHEQKAKGNQPGTSVKSIKKDVLDDSDLSDVDDSVMLVSSNSIAKLIPAKANLLTMDRKANDESIPPTDDEYDLEMCDGRSCNNSNFEDMNKKARKNPKKAASLDQKQPAKKSKINEKSVKIVRSSQDEIEEAMNDEQKEEKIIVEVEVEIVKSPHHKSLPKSTTVDEENLTEGVNKKRLVRASKKKSSNLDDRDQNGLNSGFDDHTKSKAKSASVSQGPPSEKIRPEFANAILLQDGSITTLELRQSFNSANNIIQATSIPLRVGLSKRHKFKPLHPYLEAKR